MCYKVATPAKPKLEKYLAEHHPDVRLLPYDHYYHANGFTNPLLPVQLNTEPELVQPAFWKYIPSYCSNWATVKKQYNNLNARSETIFDNKVFGGKIERYRALLWVDGFYEPHHATPGPKSKSQPFFVYTKTKEPFTLGCIWNPWVNKETGELFNSFAIITTDANQLLAQIHNEKKRMPLIIHEHDRERWLSDISKDEITGLMQPLPDGLLAAHPVSQDLNKGAINESYLQESVAVESVNPGELF